MNSFALQRGATGKLTVPLFARDSGTVAFINYVIGYAIVKLLKRI